MISIVISTRSLWACKILNGDKKIEVRKGLALYNALKKAEESGEEVEFLMYVTKAKPYLRIYPFCLTETIFQLTEDNFHSLNGMVVAKFKAKAEIIKCYEINQPFPSYHTEYVNKTNLLGKSCLTEDQIDAYLQGRRGTALRIEDLEIFDKPKELSDFGHYCNAEYCNGAGEWVKGRRFIPLQRAPQSWCYAKEGK